MVSDLAPASRLLMINFPLSTQVISDPVVGFSIVIRCLGPENEVERSNLEGSNLLTHSEAEDTKFDGTKT